LLEPEAVELLFEFYNACFHNVFKLLSFPKDDLNCSSSPSNDVSGLNLLSVFAAANISSLHSIFSGAGCTGISAPDLTLN
jgi:hypothetical protein